METTQEIEPQEQTIQLKAWHFGHDLELAIQVHGGGGALLSSAASDAPRPNGDNGPGGPRGSRHPRAGRHGAGAPVPRGLFGRPWVSPLQERLAREVARRRQVGVLTVSPLSKGSQPFG